MTKRTGERAGQSAVLPWSWEFGAGDEDRTRNFQLGSWKLASDTNNLQIAYKIDLALLHSLQFLLICNFCGTIVDKTSSLQSYFTFEGWASSFYFDFTDCSWQRNPATAARTLTRFALASRSNASCTGFILVKLREPKDTINQLNLVGTAVPDRLSDHNRNLPAAH